MYRRIPYKELLKLANEEKQTARKYAKWGLWRFSRDEAKHSRFFNMVAKGMRKRGR